MIARLITGRIIGNRVRSNIGSMKSMASLGKANERHFGAILKANFTSAPAAGISTNLKSIPLIKPKSKRIRPQLVTLTEAAKLRLKELLLDGGMLRIATKQKGCSGMPYLSRLEHSDLTSLTYSLEYVKEKGKLDEVVSDGDVSFFVESKSIMHVIGR